MKKKKFRPNRLKQPIILLFCLLFAGIGYVILFGASAASGDYSPQPERRFVLLGHLHGQFTEDEYKSLSTNYARVIINKLHGITIQDSHNAAKELKKRNPNLKVEIYWNTKYWYATNQTRYVESNGFNPQSLENCSSGITNGLCNEWYLHDLNGNIIYQHQQTDDGSGVNDNAQYVDLTNAHFRDWALKVMKHWLSVAPYDGVHFDSGSDLTDGFDGYNWTKKIGASKLAAYNTGMKDLQSRTKQATGAHEVTFNGFSPSPSRGETRSLDKLAYMDGATDEFFCFVGGVINTTHILDDIKIMQSYPAKLMMLHSSYNKSLPTSGAKPAGRFCHAAFLMGWQSGSTFHKFAIGSYTSDTLQYDLPSPDKALLPELSLNLGHPTGAYQSSGSLLWRSFDRGFVAVNLGPSSANVTLPFDVRRVEDGQDKENYLKGAAYAVPATGAAYFLKTTTPPEQGGGGGATGDGTGGGDTGGGSTGTASDNAASSGSLPNSVVNSISDLPGVLANDIRHPSNILNTIKESPNKSFVVLFLLIALLLVAGLLTPIYIALKRLPIFKPFRFALGRLQSKLFPPRWR